MLRPINLDNVIGKYLTMMLLMSFPKHQHLNVLIMVEYKTLRCYNPYEH